MINQTRRHILTYILDIDMLINLDNKFCCLPLSSLSLTIESLLEKPNKLAKCSTITFTTEDTDFTSDDFESFIMSHTAELIALQNKAPSVKIYFFHKRRNLIYQCLQKGEQISLIELDNSSDLEVIH